MTLSPTYDLVNTTLVNPADEEEMALTLNSQKKKLKKKDFVAAMNTLKVEERQQENIFNKMAKALPKWQELIDRSFMSNEFKEQYKTILTERMHRLQ
jgi:serine/threonine-protein kinase HipA